MNSTDSIKKLVQYLCEKTARGDTSSNTIFGPDVLDNTGGVVASFRSHAEAVRAVCETHNQIVLFIGGAK